MKHFLALSLFVTLLSCSESPNPRTPEPPTLIFVNGNFFTADSLHPQATAVAILNERILAVGNDADLKKLAGKETQIIDLQGAFAMPGFIEGHGHFNSLGESLQNLNLMNTKNWAEITGLVAEKAKSAKPGEWIEGRGWHQEKWSEPPGATVNGYPFNTDLSAASPNNPVVLYHASGHGLIANAKAIELAGISRETS
ncbi:MAG: amidohydrolase family protein, partial [Saprospiraceae bacterium]